MRRVSDTLQIESHQDSVIVAIRACPGAKRNEVRHADGCLKVSVTQIPEKGKANEAIRKQLAQSLDLRASQIELLHGETSAQKKFLCRNISKEEILGRIIDPLKEMDPSTLRRVLKQTRRPLRSSAKPG